MTFFPEEFINWLDDHANQIDKESCVAGNQCSRGSLSQHICCWFRRREPPAAGSGCAI